MEDLEELKQEAKKAFEIVEKIDNELTRRLNDNPTDSETTRKSNLIWHALERLREFLGV